VNLNKKLILQELTPRLSDSVKVRGAKLVAVVAEVGLAGGRLVRQAGL
jgi:hypothetical protein